MTTSAVAGAPHPAPELLECVEVQTGTRAAASVVWLHGLGADGFDFVPLVRELDARGVPALRFVFPHAPPRPITINGGAVMRAWYDIVGTDLTRREDETSIRASQQAVERLIEREHARGVPPARVVLAGFSQGGAIALQTALRYPHALAGVIALSAYLPLAQRIEAERSAASRAVPIFIAHGTADPVVPLARGAAARDRLLALGHAVQWQEYPMPHSVCAEEVDAIAAFLRRVLGA
jgi:phospholipase/carboxylesterase